MTNRRRYLIAADLRVGPPSLEMPVLAEAAIVGNGQLVAEAVTN
jgi:hypothetical protein